MRGLLETETKAITGAGTFATKYTYNSADLPTNLQYPADAAGNLSALPSLTYTYLPQMALDSLGSYVTGTQYDAAGRITNRSLGNGTAVTNTYNPWTLQGGRLSNTTAVQSGTTRQNLSYTYDAVGNITQVADALGLTTGYTYDALNRLDTTTESTKNNPEYDALTGNLLNLNGTTPATQYGYNDPEHAHAVTHIGGLLKYVYDANGNMTQRPNQTLQYNPENQLSAVTGNVNAVFVYDGDGNRVLTTINGVTTAYAGNHTEWNVTAQEMTRYYLAGSQRVAFRVIKSGQADKVFYLLADHLGSSSVVMQVGGGVESQSYTAWGELRAGGISSTKRQYTGQINEAALGLYFYNARYYDSALGRFVQADTVVPQPGSPQGWDRYAYVLNSPVNFTDPSGHRTCLIKEDCEELGTTPLEGWASRHPKEPWKDDVNYDETTNSIPGWCSDGCLNDTTRTYNSFKVWTWICKSGGWWGSGCPNGKALAAFLLWKEGGTFYNFDLYSENQADMVGRIMAGYFNYLFEDKNGITAFELSKFTAFFNPKLGTIFNSADWNALVQGPSPNSNFVTAVDTHYSQGPVIDNGYVVSRWWDTTESYPCASCTVYTSIDLVDQTRRKTGTFFFGYIP